MKLDISLAVPGLPFDGNTIKERSLGGSETAAYYLARELVNRGHRVWAFTNIKREQGGDFEGVHYCAMEDWPLFSQNVPHDVAIVQRLPQSFMSPTNAGINVLWSHDLPSGRMIPQVRGVAWNIDLFTVVSDMMADAYIDTYGLRPDTVKVTRNGIDLAAVAAARQDMADVTRQTKNLVYSARPERGLDIMLDKIMPRLLAADPDYKLFIYGYDNPVDHLAAFYAEMAARAKALPENTVIHGGMLSKADLYRAYHRHGIYAYPTPSRIAPTFKEVSCISAMEAQACGLPIVTSDVGALSETIHPAAGVLLREDPHSDDYADAFVRAILDINNGGRAGMVKAGLAEAETLDWATRAEEWEDMLLRAFDDRNGSPARRAIHFYKHSDVEAALDACDQADGDPVAESLKAKIHSEYAFIQSPDKTAAHYEAGGKDTDERLTGNAAPADIFHHAREPRFERIAAFLEENTAGDATVLDYGCGHGWFSIWAHNTIGRKWIGLDLDPGAVKWSRTHADRHAAVPGDLAYHAWPDDALIVSADAGVISEVLEHVADPVATMLEFESMLEHGAPVVVTVPAGPAEYGTYNWFAFRNHVWHFTAHDLAEMFGEKPDFNVIYVPGDQNAITCAPTGNYVVTYRADREQIGAPDRERKQALVRPRETVSASLICGGPFVEETLHWCLRSLSYVVDEIVIADCGMTEEARRIAEMYGARLVPGPNPLEHGFEAARNASLDACRMDWVLWIDADERLVDGHNLAKYLRRSLYDGFAIHQHHFTCDTKMKADTPVRLFRRDRGIRFWGMIHEHPEKAINEGPGEVIILSDVHIAHVGYLSETIRRKRFERNHPLLKADEAKYPHRKLQKYMIMRDNDLLTMYEEQQGLGLTPEGVKRMQETVALYREYFLGKPGYIGADALGYYSKALQNLGIGFDTTFSLGVSRDGVGGHDETVTTARFADRDEAMIEIASRLKERFGPVEKEYW